MQKFTLNEVAAHHTHEDIWVVIREKIYDVTLFLQKHPGGKNVFLSNAGKDVTSNFEAFFHSENAYLILETSYVGTLIR